MTILVAEDNQQGRYLLEQYLAARGHTVWGAADGRAALDLCQERGAPDVVVSDALMPRMDGFEFCHALRCDRRLCTVPFILYTATYTDAADERFALSVGADRFVVKPVEPPDLLVIIESVAAAAGATAGRRPLDSPAAPSFFEEHARMISVKLEEKVAELSQANSALADSERSVRELNHRLLATVRRLEGEIEERRQATELLRLAQRAGGVGSWSLELAGDAFSCTSEGARILGFGDEPASGRLRTTLLERVIERDRPAATRILGGQATGAFALEFGYVRPGESGVRTLSIAGECVAPAGGQARIYGIVQDITARVAAAARRQAIEQQAFQSQKMEALGTLAGGVAHDFNNILTTILFSAELADAEVAGLRGAEAVRASLSEIVHAAQRSRDLIRQILTFSRQQSVERTVQPLGPVIESGLRLVRAALDKRIEFRAELDCPVRVLANDNQLHQVLLNLCTNAGHAMREQGGVLTVRARPVEISAAQAAERPELQPGSYARIEVADTGVGMSPEVLARIFEPFFTTRGESEGTGLGLAVVHGIVRAHDGFITVDSAPGRGTTFAVFLPIVTAPVAPAAPAPAPAASPVSPRRIFVVDDEPGAVRTVGRILERLGHEPRVFTDPVEAREAFVRDPRACDLAIVDFLMPRLTGPDLARAFWAVRPGLPVILIAGFGTQVDASRARADGFREMLAKPISSATLADAIARSITAAP